MVDEMSSNDRALAIGENAFRAGFEAAWKFQASNPRLVVGFELAVEMAWSNYDPPEDIKELA